MISDGLVEVLRSLRTGSGVDPAETSTRVLGVGGVTVSLLAGDERMSALPAGDDRMSEPLWSFPELSARYEELQFTLGEGPGPDAVRSGVPVLEPDLQRVRPDRWPALLPAALDLGVHGVCCFPLALGAVRLGVLTLLCDATRRLSARQCADANTLATVLTSMALNGGRPAAPGRTDNVNGEGAMTLQGAPERLYRAVVHQATGMISGQLGVPVKEALVRLRAFAYRSEQPVSDVATDVVARRLRFDDDMGGPSSPDGGEG
ncbi:ANTAR domain-containing protein [Streptomyces sp. NBC_01381]|uniref:ANTAR domain-containing protein n=1 Tax=Streptomyces sp. NBC_01381 TaxID=2903845 RepID=UPI002255ABB9|nr:ANTAR domain-containing protein [Streptomyces sp. NBC_01381]MCX4665507.1 ANTAR domain-containing protein [Streptomyces sp. NBC_01381]